jgi:hypothetical protein
MASFAHLSGDECAHNDKDPVLRRRGIMEALWARRCYATNGERIVLVHVPLEPLPRTPLQAGRGNLRVAYGDDAWSSPIWVHVEGKV